MLVLHTNIRTILTHSSTDTTTNLHTRNKQVVEWKEQPIGVAGVGEGKRRLPWRQQLAPILYTDSHCSIVRSLYCTLLEWVCVCERVRGIQWQKKRGELVNHYINIIICILQQAHQHKNNNTFSFYTRFINHMSNHPLPLYPPSSPKSMLFTQKKEAKTKFLH